MCKHMYRYGKEMNTRVIQLPYALRATVNYGYQAPAAGTVAREPTTIYSAIRGEVQLECKTDLQAAGQPLCLFAWDFDQVSRCLLLFGTMQDFGN